MIIASANRRPQTETDRTRQKQRENQRESRRSGRSSRPRRFMDGGDGWHVTAGAGAGAGGGGGGQDKTIINRIMLRFRPIAPKLATVASSSGEASPEGKERSFFCPIKKVKRKYIRSKKSNNRSCSTGDREDGTTITLHLLSGGDAGAGGDRERSWLRLDRPVGRTNLDFSSHQQTNTRGLNGMVAEEPVRSDRSKRLVVAAAPPAVESWVTVESVTDTCMDVRGLGCTDEEKVRSLEKDTCPGFISDGFNRVYWVNDAYKKMVSQGQPAPAPEVRVWLLTKAELPGNIGQFCCSVRLQYTWERERCSKMVPCDVWKMQESTGLAWRLDMKAALSLGL